MGHSFNTPIFECLKDMEKGMGPAGPWIPRVPLLGGPIVDGPLESTSWFYWRLAAWWRSSSQPWWLTPFPWWDVSATSQARFRKNAGWSGGLVFVGFNWENVVARVGQRLCCFCFVFFERMYINLGIILSCCSCVWIQQVRPLKNGAWKTILSYWKGNFRRSKHPNQGNVRFHKKQLLKT